MSGGQNEAPRGWQTDKGRDGNSYANAAGTLEISKNIIKRHWLSRAWVAIQAIAARVAS